MREYRVVEVKKKGFVAGRFNAEKFQAMLNEEARGGWTFDKVVSHETRVLDRDTFMDVFFREKPAGSG